MNCPYCKKEIGDDASFCRYCGKKIVRCPTCSRVIEYKMRFCPNDRTEIPEEMTRDLPDWSAVLSQRSKPQPQPCPAPSCPEPSQRVPRKRAWQTSATQHTSSEGVRKRIPVWVLLLVLALILGAGAVVGIKVLRDRNSRGEAVSSADGTSLTEGEGGAAAMDGVLTPEDENTGTQDGSQPKVSLENQQPEASQAEVQAAEEQEKSQQKPLTGASGLGAVPTETIEQLAQSIDCGTWDTSRKVQGVEWNTDTMDTFYVCYDSYIVAYDANGKYKTQCNDVKEGHLFSIDYYDGKVLSVMRSSGYSRLKLRVYDAETMELLNSVDLNDIKDQYSSDKKKYNYDNLVPFIGGITVAPAFGSQTEEKLYICYNVYYDEDNCLALNEKQMIFEYNYKKAIKAKKTTKAKRILTVDLGSVEYGIQTLEFDRTTENFWCGVHRGLSDYSLYCIDGSSSGNKLSLIPNGNASGWNCPMGESGLCSLGNDCFYVLVPQYRGDSVATEIRKVSRSELESIDW